MNKRKIQLIPALPMPPKKTTNTKKPKCSNVTPENLREAYSQMFHLKNLVENHIPLLVTDNQEKDKEIQKLKSEIEMKDEQLNAQHTQKR